MTGGAVGAVGPLGSVSTEMECAVVQQVPRRVLAGLVAALVNEVPEAVPVPSALVMRWAMGRWIRRLKQR